MDTPIVLKMPTGDLVLIFSGGTVLFVEPDGEVVELADVCLASNYPSCD